MSENDISEGMTPSYKNPPIVEAVLEVRFGRQIDMGSIPFDIAKQFPNAKIEQGIKLVTGYSPEDDGTPVPIPVNVYSFYFEKDLYRLSISDVSILFSKHQPYDTWQNFSDLFQKHYEFLYKEFQGVVSYRRLGLRYINKIDRPNLTDAADFLKNSYVSEHLKGLNLTEYSESLTFKEKEISCKARHQLTPSNEEYILTIDIDVSTEAEPQNLDPEILFDWSERARVIKNRVFEEMITDQARDYFNGRDA